MRLFLVLLATCVGPSISQSSIRVYPTRDCSGSVFLDVPAAKQEARCTACWDFCGKRWPGSTAELHGTQRSILIPPGMGVTLWGDCMGTWEYPHAEMLGAHCVASDAAALCLPINAQNRYEVAHLKLVRASDVVCTGGVNSPPPPTRSPPSPFPRRSPPPAAVRALQQTFLNLRHWQIGAPSYTQGLGTGFSWYSRLWNMVATPAALDNFQVGLGGTWLIPDAEYNQCACPAGKWPATEGCCDSDCFNLYQVMEGGPGYWGDEFPSRGAKYRLNLEMGCYTRGTGSAHWHIGGVGECADLEEDEVDGCLGKFLGCSNLGGVVTLTNRLLLAPDGLGLKQTGGEGMLGTAWLSTAMGARSPAETLWNTTAGATSQTWTFVMDAVNFAGPVAFAAPQYWRDIKVAPDVPDFSMTRVGAMLAGLGFEWNTLPGFVVGQGPELFLKLPPLGFPAGDALSLPAGSALPAGALPSILIMGMWSWTRAALYEPLESALTKVNGWSTWKDEGVMREVAGAKMPCDVESEPAALGFPASGLGLGLGAQLITARTKDGECVGGLIWDKAANCTAPSSTGGRTCYSPQAWRLRYETAAAATAASSAGKITDPEAGADLKEISPILGSSGVPSWVAAAGLTSATFQEKEAWGQYSVPKPGAPDSACITRPGPASKQLCRLTVGGTWLKYAWYRFVDQPALQRLQLTAAQKDFMQARVIALHKALARASPKGINKWIKAPKGLPQLASMDPQMLVTPPLGMEAGYVPIVLYEGVQKPPGC